MDKMLVDYLINTGKVKVMKTYKTSRVIFKDGVYYVQELETGKLYGNGWRAQQTARKYARTLDEFQKVE